MSAFGPKLTSQIARQCPLYARKRTCAGTEQWKAAGEVCPTLFVSQNILRMFSYPCCSHVVWSHRHRLTPIENAWKNLVTCMKKGRFISGLFLFGLSIQCFKLVAGE